MPRQFKENDVDLGRLCDAMRKSRTTLRKFREERRDAVKQYVGRHWSEDGSSEKVPVNLIALYASIVGRNLIAKNPRVMLSTFDQQHKPAVSAMQTWCNQEIERMRLANTLQRVVLDALFSVGIAKVALASAADASLAGWNMKAGTPFCEPVDLDDFVYDVHARDFREASFMGHRYRVPMEAIQDDPAYNRAQRKSLAVSSDSPYNLEGDERIGYMGRGSYGTNTEEFEDFVDLWEIYIPRKRLILTLADDGLSGGAGAGTDGTLVALREQEWLGPDTGPYHILAFGTVPGNAMPKAPIQDLIDLHELVNTLYRKLGRQSERQKELLAVQGGATEDGNRIIDASDGEALRVDNPERSKVMTFGGPNQQNLAMAIHSKDLFAYLAGNLDMMGGLSPQSKTLGQDRMLEQNASRAIADLQDRTVSFTQEVGQALCWYWWNDPFQTMRTKHSLPGMAEMQITRKVTPEQRSAVRFEDLEIAVDPYSMQHSTPSSRAQGLTQLVTQIVMPMMPLLQQQGVMFDINIFLTKLAAYMDMPDLAEIMTVAQPPQSEPGGQGGPEKPGMPANTQRNYVRESMPGRTQKSDDMNLVNTLMGGDPGGASNGHSTNGMPQ